MARVSPVRISTPVIIPVPELSPTSLRQISLSTVSPMVQSFLQLPADRYHKPAVYFGTMWMADWVLVPQPQLPLFKLPVQTQLNLGLAIAVPYRTHLGFRMKTRKLMSE